MGKAQHESVTTQTRFSKWSLLPFKSFSYGMRFYFFSDVGESGDGKSSRALGWSVEGIGLLTAEPMCRPYPVKKIPFSHGFQDWNRPIWMCSGWLEGSAFLRPTFLPLSHEIHQPPEPPAQTQRMLQPQILCATTREVLSRPRERD